MDRRARIDNPLLPFKALLKSDQADIFTCLPGIYKGPGIKNQTAKVQPAIKAKLRKQDGTFEDRNYPLCINCPILFPGGGGFQLTFPIADGDEGLLVFSQRCIDAWWESGGVQPQAEMRMHDISDGFFVPGQLSQSKVPSTAASTSTTQLRSEDGETYIELAAENVVNVHASGGTTITGPVTITGPLTLESTVSGKNGAAISGNLHMAGSVQADGNVTAGSVSLNSHVHGGVYPGGSSTTGPT
jgi:hypothetical protein